ncbi:uncharacterized protein [Eleutherodactylus coqui]|uniref:uncharacterized protein n=1 Tax=Eleutherodactylus coqui TaxID=57060 RepID=UPI003461F853
MKIVCPLLVIAAVCCFAPAMSSVIRDGNDEQDSVGGQSCLEKSVDKKKNPSTQMLDLICAHMKFKDDLMSEQTSKGEPSQGNKRITRQLPEDILGGNAGLSNSLLGEDKIVGGLLGGEKGGLLDGILGIEEIVGGEKGGLLDGILKNGLVGGLFGREKEELLNGTLEGDGLVEGLLGEEKGELLDDTLENDGLFGVLLGGEKGGLLDDTLENDGLVGGILGGEKGGLLDGIFENDRLVGGEKLLDGILEKDGLVGGLPGGEKEGLGNNLFGEVFSVPEVLPQ